MCKYRVDRRLKPRPQIVRAHPRHRLQPNRPDPLWALPADRSHLLPAHRGRPRAGPSLRPRVAAPRFPRGLLPEPVPEGKGARPRAGCALVEVPADVQVAAEASADVRVVAVASAAGLVGLLRVAAVRRAAEDRLRDGLAGGGGTSKSSSPP